MKYYILLGIIIFTSLVTAIPQYNYETRMCCGNYTYYINQTIIGGEGSFNNINVAYLNNSGQIFTGTQIFNSINISQGGINIEDINGYAIYNATYFTLYSSLSSMVGIYGSTATTFYTPNLKLFFQIRPDFTDISNSTMIIDNAGLAKNKSLKITNQLLNATGNITTPCITFKDGTTQCSASASATLPENVTFVLVNTTYLNVTNNLIARKEDILTNLSVNDTVTARKYEGYGIVPIGSVQAWIANFSGTPALPNGWAMANGQNITDSESPYYGKNLPNLNGDSGQTKRFLRGNVSSGATGGADAHTHTITRGTNCVTAYSGSCTVVTSVTTPTGAASQPLPSYYEVVWIIRIK